jgi:hypothetical protein
MHEVCGCRRTLLIANYSIRGAGGNELERDPPDPATVSRHAMPSYV